MKYLSRTYTDLTKARMAKCFFHDSRDMDMAIWKGCMVLESQWGGCSHCSVLQ